MGQPQNVALLKVKEPLPHDLVIPLLGVHGREKEAGIYIPRLDTERVVALFAMATNWKPPKRLSGGSGSSGTRKNAIPAAIRSTTGPGSNRDRPQCHYAERKKPDPNRALTA